MGVPGEHRAAWGSENQGRTLGEREAPTDGPGPRHLPLVSEAVAPTPFLTVWSRAVTSLSSLSLPRLSSGRPPRPHAPRVPRADGHAQHRAGAPRTCVKRSCVSIGDCAQARDGETACEVLRADTTSGYLWAAGSHLEGNHVVRRVCRTGQVSSLRPRATSTCRCLVLAVKLRWGRTSSSHLHPALVLHNG